MTVFIQRGYSTILEKKCMLFNYLPQLVMPWSEDIMYVV